MECGSNRAEVSVGAKEVGVELYVTAGSQRRVVMSVIASQQERLSWTSEKYCETRYPNIDVSCVKEKRRWDIMKCGGW